MPPRTEWSWTEAFGLLEANPALVHGSVWREAWGAAGREVARRLPDSDLAAIDAECARLRALPPVEPLGAGSGWGALERIRSGGAAADGFTAARPFPREMIGQEEAPWLALLETGSLPEPADGDDPGALMVQSEWLDLLRRSANEPRSDHWLTWWHIGNACMEARDLAGAREAWLRSLGRRRTGWALRNLSVLATREGDPEGSLELLREAWETGPRVAALAVELLQALSQAARWDEMLAFRSALPTDLASHERVLLLWAKAALETGRLEGVDVLFSREFASIREGEVSLSDLWFAWHESRISTETGSAVDEELRTYVRRTYPPPRNIDFRMAG
jgi:hypothetical protein